MHRTVKLEDLERIAAGSMPMVLVKRADLLELVELAKRAPPVPACWHCGAGLIPEELEPPRCEDCPSYCDGCPRCAHVAAEDRPA
jgi:hypothetical protein